MILSTPNSYHKGQCSVGRRRFCYWGYNYMDNKNCWVSSPSWDNPLKFKEAVSVQNAKSNDLGKNNEVSKGKTVDASDNLSMISKLPDSNHSQIISELEAQVNILSDQLRGVYLQIREMRKSNA